MQASSLSSRTTTMCSLLNVYLFFVKICKILFELLWIHQTRQVSRVKDFIILLCTVAFSEYKKFFINVLRSFVCTRARYLVKTSSYVWECPLTLSYLWMRNLCTVVDATRLSHAEVVFATVSQPRRQPSGTWQKPTRITLKWRCVISCFLLADRRFLPPYMAASQRPFTLAGLQNNKLAVNPHRPRKRLP